MYITPADNRTNFRAQIVSYDPGAANLARASFQFFQKETDAAANELRSIYQNTYLITKIKQINSSLELIIRNLTTKKELSVPIKKAGTVVEKEDQNAYLRLLKKVTNDGNFWDKDKPKIIETANK